MKNFIFTNNRLYISFLAFLFFSLNCINITKSDTDIKKTEFIIAGAKVIFGYPIEGNLIIAKTDPSYKIMLDSADIFIDQDGLFVFGFHRDAETNSELKIKTEDGFEFITVLRPIQRKYFIERIDGLKRSMVTPSQDDQERIENDIESVRFARNIKTPTGDFWKGFDWPVVGRISGSFGSQRILNGIPKTPHYGVDIAAPQGTLIMSPASGIVTLAKDLYYSGNTVILNHGLSVNSTFLHLDKIFVKVGDEVERGKKIGLLGQTGRSTGPHLDWRIDWKGRRLDPEMLAGSMNK